MGLLYLIFPAYVAYQLLRFEKESVFYTFLVFSSLIGVFLSCELEIATFFSVAALSIYTDLKRREAQESFILLGTAAIAAINPDLWKESILLAVVAVFLSRFLNADGFFIGLSAETVLIYTQEINLSLISIIIVSAIAKIVSLRYKDDLGMPAIPLIAIAFSLILPLGEIYG